MSPFRYSRTFVALHWATVILLFSSAVLAKQKELPALPLNLHTILGGFLLIVMLVRLASKIKALQYGFSNKIETAFYLTLYLLVFFVLGMGVQIAYQRNLLGYLLDPNSAIGRGSFKHLTDIHKLGWQILFGWIIMHIAVVGYRQFFKKEAVLHRMWFRRTQNK